MIVDLIFGVSQEQVPDGEDDPLSDERVLSVRSWTVQKQLDSLSFSNLRNIMHSELVTKSFKENQIKSSMDFFKGWGTQLFS